MRLKKLPHLLLSFFAFTLYSSFFVSSAFAFSGSGSGTSGDPFQITTCAQFQEMANNLSAYYQEDNDIDCTGISFTPIGTSITPFTGTFDGKNYAISNLTLSGSSGYVGLFGYTANVTLKNIRIVSGSVNDSGNYTGSLIGYADQNLTVTHSSSQIAVTGNAYTGGLIGYVVGPATLQKVFYSGTIGSNLNGGGLVGSFSGSSNVLSDCYTTGSISGSSGNYGGLTGINAIGGSAAVSNCYSAMTITPNFSGQNFGGLFGVDKTGTVTNSFSVGSVSGSGTNIGGIIGNSDTVTSGVYLDVFTAGTSGCIGAGTSTCIGVNSGNSTPNYFKNNTTNAPLNAWDFSTIWQTNSNAYPTLQGFSSPAPITPTPTSAVSSSSGNPGNAMPSAPGCGDAAPATAPNLFQLRAKGNSVTLYFAPDSGQNSSYYIGYGFDVIAQNFGTTFNYTNSGGAVAYTVNALFPGTWYFKVRGQNGCMPGAWSGVMKVKVT